MRRTTSDSRPESSGGFLEPIRRFLEPIRRFLEPIRTWLALIKFSHSVFALPFALIALVAAARTHGISALQFGAIVGAVVSARSAAMGFNRLADRDIDAENPRTAQREIPRGAISPLAVRWGIAASAAVFLVCAAILGMHCLVLAPAVLALLFLYSLTKRFTRWCHVVLGTALACAPGGAWYAVTGETALPPLWLMAAVVTWVAGFDIIYACQDEQFDRERALESIPASWGVARALVLARFFHMATIALLFEFGRSAGLGAWYFTGLAAFGVLILSQHLMVRAGDLSRVDAAFFSRNGLAGILLALMTVLDTW